MKTTSTGEERRDARLDAIAGARALLTNDQEGLASVVEHTGDLEELAHAAIGLAASLLALMPEASRSAILAGLTAATLGPGGARP